MSEAGLPWSKTESPPHWGCERSMWGLHWEPPAQAGSPSLPRPLPASAPLPCPLPATSSPAPESSAQVLQMHFYFKLCLALVRNDFCWVCFMTD